MSLCMKSLAKSKYELKVDNTTQWINNKLQCSGKSIQEPLNALLDGR